MGQSILLGQVRMRFGHDAQMARSEEGGLRTARGTIDGAASKKDADLTMLGVRVNWRRGWLLDLLGENGSNKR